MKWQSFVLSLAISKYLIVEFLSKSLVSSEEGVVSNATTIALDYNLSQITVAVSILVFGNMLDNTHSQKHFVVSLDIILCFLYSLRTITAIF